jgi:[ribosomal protein S5]-alanine N-acetyltransferase
MDGTRGTCVVAARGSGGDVVTALRPPGANAPPFLSGARVYLRPLVEADVDDDYLAWMNDHEVTRYIESAKYPVTRESLLRFVARFKDSPSDVGLAIVDRATDARIGSVTLNHINWVHRRADTGIMVGRKEYWGKGLAFESWALLIGYAFERLGLRRIVAGAHTANAGSVATLKKLGFTHEGTLRQHDLIDGRYCDTMQFGLLREEFVGFRREVSSQSQ